MERSIGDVARLTGLTARTLRHYDEIGLLHPFRIGANGYRWYGRTQLRRLQRILLLRELGLPLAEIRAILDGESDELAFLLQHRDRLNAERMRLEQVIDTIGRTIDDIRGVRQLEDKDFFVGLKRRTQELETELVSRFGPDVRAHFTNAETTTATWTRQDHERAAARGRDLLRRLAAAREAGFRPDDAEVLDLMAEHYAQVRQVWPANAAAYYALAETTLDSPQLRLMIAEVDPALPSWLADAIRAYAIHRLGHSPDP